MPSPLGATVDAALSMDFPEEGETGLTTDATVEMNAGLVKRFADRWAKGPARLRFETNGRDEVSVEARLERLSIAGIEATAPDFEADLQLQDRDEAFFQLMGLVFSPPELPLSWIQALPKRLEVPRLDAAALGAERDVAIRDVKVEVGVNVFSLTATAKGSFADVPPALLTRIFPDAPALQGPQPPRVTGAFEVTVDPAKPKDTRRELTLGSSP